MLRLSSSKFAPTTKRQNSDYDALERRGYRFGKRIGKGSYGCVVVARYEDRKRGKRIDLACKCVVKDKAPKDFLDKFFPREIDVLRRIRHEHIISIHSILQSGSTVFIFMRWAELGDLLDFVQKKGAIGESHSCLWFYQMVSAVRYLHSLDYAHRDLKCENVLISRRMNIKIADFGFARKCSDERTGDKIMSETFCGSAAYAAPEIVCGKAYEPMKTDVWSLGCILFIMLNAVMPFDDTNSRRLLRDQKRRNYKFADSVEEKLSDGCKSVIHELLEPSPERRPDIERVYQAEWLRKHTSKCDEKR